MDVLQIIKSDHTNLLQAVDDLGTLSLKSERFASFCRLVTDLSRHLWIEEQYIYPEAAGMFRGSDRFIEEAIETHARIIHSLGSLARAIAKPGPGSKAFKSSLQSTRDMVASHFRLEEEHVMPAIRSAMVTQDREDLGQVVLDAMEEDLLEVPRTAAILTSLKPIVPKKYLTISA